MLRCSSLRAGLHCGRGSLHPHVAAEASSLCGQAVFSVYLHPTSLWGAQRSLNSQAGPSPPILGSHSASVWSGRKYKPWPHKQMDDRRLEQVP